MERLALLAVQLSKCRKRGNKLTLECVLESARILTEAKNAAKRRFGQWLTEVAHMDRSTAGRYLRVATFVRQNGALMHQIATLSLAKIYALSAIDSALATRVLMGEIKLSEPLDVISDVRFRREFRERFPARKRHSRHHVFQAATSSLTRAARAVQEASPFVRSMTPGQRQKIEHQIQALVKLISGWKGVA
jgi:hypothetical protein